MNITIKQKVRPQWYIEGAPKLLNRHWSFKEKYFLYTLSKQGLSTVDMIQKMGVSLTKRQVYNQIRMAKKAFQNKCHRCGEPVNVLSGKLFQLCNTCKQDTGDYKKEKRLREIKKNICPICSERSALPKKTFCGECLSGTYRRRIAIGLCGFCGKTPINRERSVSLCTACLDAMRMKSYRWSKH